MGIDLEKRIEGVGDKPGQEPEVRMTFGEHLEELRSRLFKSVVVLLVAIIACMFVYQPLVAFISEPHFKAMELLKVPREKSLFLSESYTTPVVAMMKLAFIIALFVASPVIGYQLWAFISAGLYKNERKYVVSFAPISFLLFCLGCVFGFFILTPLALYGLANMLDPKLVAPMYNFSDYLGLVMKLTILLGAIFQLPLLMVFFAKIGIVQPKTYNEWRRAAVIGNVVFAAVITPADVLTMLLVMIPLLLLYEIGVIFSYLLARPANPVEKKA